MAAHTSAGTERRVAKPLIGAVPPLILKTVPIQAV